MTWTIGRMKDAPLAAGMCDVIRREFGVVRDCEVGLDVSFQSYYLHFGCERGASMLLPSESISDGELVEMGVKSRWKKGKYNISKTQRKLILKNGISNKLHGYLP